MNSAAGFIQTALSKKLRLRQFPKLTFLVDNSIKEGFEMVNTLNALEAEEKARAEQEASTAENNNAKESD